MHGVCVPGETDYHGAYHQRRGIYQRLIDYNKGVLILGLAMLVREWGQAVALIPLKISYNF